MTTAGAAPAAPVLGIDCSTTACKAVLWQGDGKSCASGRATFELDNPEPDAWQQSADDWWQALCAACRQLPLAEASLAPAAIGITHQRETFVVTDGAGEPLHPALVWMDHRCTGEVDEAVSQLGAEALHRISGKPAHTTPSLYKLMFLLKQQPQLAGRIGKVLDVGAFLAWKLTGRCATSLASADPMGMDSSSQRLPWVN